MSNKIFIDDRYFPKDEIRNNLSPYYDYYQCLSKTFNLAKINSFCDVGCANGPLLYFVKDNIPHMDIMGLEYFAWQKNAANQIVKESINIHDLRDEWMGDKKYELVNCTETGEHIDPAYCDVFMENLKKVCKKYLVISWSDTGGANDREHDEHEQHLNPLSSSQVDSLLTRHGFIKNQELTNKFILESHNKSDFNFWWRKSLGIWEIQG
jgi:hypothetical protein